MKPGAPRWSSPVTDDHFQGADSWIVFVAPWSNIGRVLVDHLTSRGVPHAVCDITEEPHVADRYGVRVLPSAVHLTGGAPMRLVTGRQLVEAVGVGA